MTKAELMQCLEEIANAEFGGHFTVMKFTTNWRVCFGTPMTAHSREPSDVEMCAGKTFEEAAMRAIERRERASCITWHDRVAEKKAIDAMCVKIETMTDEEIAAVEAELKRFYARQPDA